MEAGTEPDEGLLLAAGRGDGAAWEAFRRRSVPLVAGYLLRRADECHVAELTDETFAAALLASGEFLPGDRSARDWLLEIAGRTLRSSRRRGRIERSARRHMALEGVDGAERALAGAQGPLPPGAAGPLVLDPGAAIRHAIGELPRCQRAAVDAWIVGEPIGAACTPCALQSLRTRLGQAGAASIRTPHRGAD